MVSSFNVCEGLGPKENMVVGSALIADSVIIAAIKGYFGSNAAVALMGGAGAVAATCGWALVAVAVVGLALLIFGALRACRGSDESRGEGPTHRFRPIDPKAGGSFQGHIPRPIALKPQKNGGETTHFQIVNPIKIPTRSSAFHSPKPVPAAPAGENTPQDSTLGLQSGRESEELQAIQDTAYALGISTWVVE